MSDLALTTHVADLPLTRRRDVDGLMKMNRRCVADLIQHLPLRYERELEEQSIAELHDGVLHEAGSAADVAIRGELLEVRFPHTRRQPVSAVVEDGTGTARLAWFNSPWMRGKLHPGVHVLISGRAESKDEQLQLINPRWSTFDPDDPPPQRTARLRPVYPANDLISPRRVEQIIESILDDALALLEDHLTADYRRELALPSLAEAYRSMHAPDDGDAVARGRRRLAYDDLFMLELGVMLKRHDRRGRQSALPLQWSADMHERITARFGFPLTKSQQQVIEEIAADLREAVPMNRLLQGDVGAGKTVVALYAMLMAVASGYQAALMAPTELLAEQHLRSIRRFLEGGDVTVELLTGSLKSAPRRQRLQRLAAGEIDIVVGTHALLTESVAFDNLAVAVIDEQHRFGVHQRATIRTKVTDETRSPHVLVMTATPIPRTLSLTIFGDLDVSTISTLPPGRTPVITRHAAPDQRETAYTFLRERIELGEQGFVVVPVIEESAAGLQDLASHITWLREGPLAGHTVEPLHGRLGPEEREGTMSRFIAGDVDAVVATTVIEVGVDIPRATVMVIENAERFGLAQLHQLRGRVGRGDLQGVCVLIADPTTDDGKARIDAMTETTDGFVIAEKDLLIRGPGELFGSRQSGLPPFLVAELPRDMKLLRRARRDASAMVADNPMLEGEEHALLRRRLLKAYGAALGLGDVG